MKNNIIEISNLDVAIDNLLKSSEEKKRKFNESVDIAVTLGIDPKQSNQMVKGSIMLPHGSGKSYKILVLTADKEAQKSALDVGATYAGDEEMIEKIVGGFADFDICITTPDYMPKVSKAARKLGPRGLMPNAKNGTVTDNINKAVTDGLKGKVNFRNDKYGIIHSLVGKVSFSKDNLLENINVVLKSISELKPENSKGKFIKKLFINSTMGKSFEVDVNSLNLTR
ncbi:50S ribosomal protein L1 [Rickettsiales bacterium]|nr:50S ribosomal protein L1 [Rickettsiales bacterium]